MEPCIDYDTYACPPSHTVTVQSIVHQAPAEQLASTGADPTSALLFSFGAICAAIAIYVFRNNRRPRS